MLHELARLTRELMDVEGMTQADLVRRSGLSAQHVSTMLKADRPLMRMPDVRTFEGLFRAFPSVPPSVFVLAAAAAVGLHVDTGARIDYRLLSDEQLLGLLKGRLGRQLAPPAPDADQICETCGTRFAGRIEGEAGSVGLPPTDHANGPAAP